MESTTTFAYYETPVSPETMGSDDLEGIVIQRRGTHLRIAPLLVAVTLAMCRFAAGQPVPVANPGFETDPVSSNCFAGFIPTAWTLYDPNGIYDGAVGAVGGLNTEPGGPHFIDGAPEGDHVALVFLDGDIGGGPMGLTQILADVLAPNETYTLSAQVGNIASVQGPPPCDIFGFFDLDGFPGYQVQLLAGGVVIAQDDNSLAGSIPEGEFRLSSCQVTIGAEHPQLGQTLEVRLINLNMIDTPENPGIEVDFDDVRLVRGCAADADPNADGQVNLIDFTPFAVCFAGAGQSSPPAGCSSQEFAAFDLDCDGDVDLSDFSTFASIFTG